MKRCLAALVVLSACGPAPRGAEPAPPGRCEVGSSTAALQSVDRKIVGLGAAYRGDGTLRGREGDLARSQRLRREVAWETVAKVLAPVPLAEALPAAPEPPAQIPAWQTWYGRDDLARVFHRLYDALGPDGRKQRAPFSEASLDSALSWNVGALSELSNWPEERFRDYVSSIDEASEVAGLGGIARIGYSPAAARHLLTSYPEALGCLSNGTPEPIAKGPVVETRLLRERVVAAPCERRVLGAFVVAEGETLKATLEGEGGAELSLQAEGGAEVCRAEAGEPCEVDGPGTFDVTAAAGEVRLDATVTVSREAARPEWAACLAGAFPLDGAVVKAEWRRAQLGQKLPVFSTTADALSRRVKRGEVSWDEPDGEEDPGAEDIHTLKLANGAVYRLAGLHIMTKELDHWLWITLWWSPSPDEDFGADRPSSITALGGAWRSYKMCVASAFNEEDPDAEGGFGADHPSLARALAAVHAGPSAPSWCSNPYLEHGAGNAGTNCIGCHQHGGVELRSEDILADNVHFPDHGRVQVRNNFPTDYSWAVTSGDQLVRLFADEEAYYGAAE